MKAFEIIALAESETGEDKKSGAQKIWGPADWLLQMNRGLRQLHSDVPELRLRPVPSMPYKADNAPTVEDDQQPVDLRAPHLEALVQFMAWKFFARDAGDSKDNARARSHREAYDLAVFGRVRGG